MAVFAKPSVGVGASTLPQRYYVSEEVFGAETERLFHGQWMCVGRAEQLARPGDYFLAEIAGESLILVRGRDGAIRAFFNVCRHRGTRLCTAERGQFNRSIQCPYHAWTYGLDGQLTAARYMRDTPARWRSGKAFCWSISRLSPSRSRSPSRRWSASSAPGRCRACAWRSAPSTMCAPTGRCSSRTTRSATTAR